MVVHAVAAHLEVIGCRPAALVLTDPYAPEKRRVVRLLLGA